jgi:cytoskeletal protein RodZ
MAETFGIILAEARMKRGLTLEQVSDVLRIRPAILASLEREDYFGMPLKGHSRNMVSAYSRFLGLDSAAVTELFLQNYRDFEHAEAARRRENQRTPIDVYSVFPPGTAQPTTRSRDGAANAGQGVRSIWDKPTPSSELHSGYDSRSPHIERSAKSAARRRPSQGSASGAAAGVGSGRSSGELGRNSVNRSGGVRGGTSGASGSASNARGTRSSSAFSQAMGAGSANRNEKNGTLRRLMTTTPLPLILLVVLVVLALVFWSVRANSKKNDTGSNAYIPIQSGGSQTNQNDDEAKDDVLTNPGMIPDEPTADMNYGPFELKVDVDVDNAPWVMIMVDGQEVFNGILNSPAVYTVQINCEVQTGRPGSTTVYRNGVRQEMEIGRTGAGTIKMQIIEKPVNDHTTNPPVDDKE